MEKYYEIVSMTIKAAIDNCSNTKWWNAGVKRIFKSDDKNEEQILFSRMMVKNEKSIKKRCVIKSNDINIMYTYDKKRIKGIKISLKNPNNFSEEDFKILLCVFSEAIKDTLIWSMIYDLEKKELIFYVSKKSSMVVTRMDLYVSLMAMVDKKCKEWKNLVSKEVEIITLANDANLMRVMI